MNYQRFVAPAVALVAGLTLAALLGVPVLAYVPVAVLVLACPLMMVFMMRGMSHGTRAAHDSTSSAGEGERR